MFEWNRYLFKDVGPIGPNLPNWEAKSKLSAVCCFQCFALLYFEPVVVDHHCMKFKRNILLPSLNVSGEETEHFSIEHYVFFAWIFVFMDLCLHVL